MSESCRQNLSDGREWWEALTNIWEWSGGPPGCSKLVGRPSRMFGSGRETLPNVPEWSGVPPGCLGVVGGPYKYPGVVGRPSRMSRSGRETLPNVPEW